VEPSGRFIGLNSSDYIVGKDSTYEFKPLHAKTIKSMAKAQAVKASIATTPEMSDSRNVVGDAISRVAKEMVVGMAPPFVTAQTRAISLGHMCQASHICWLRSIRAAESVQRPPLPNCTFKDLRIQADLEGKACPRNSRRSEICTGPVLEPRRGYADRVAARKWSFR
jgi:hypothetical protein